MKQTYETEYDFLKIYKNQYHIGEKQIERYLISHPGAVTIIGITKTKKLIILKQYRHTINQWLWEIPAGKIDSDEDLLTAAQRELVEETGYTSDDWSSFDKLYTGPGFTDECLYFYIALNCEKTEDLNLDEDEEIEVYLKDLSELKEMIETNEIKDLKTRFAIEYLLKENYVSSRIS